MIFPIPMEDAHKIAEVINSKYTFAIRKVIFNYPATIVFWEDGTKTVVKAGKREPYDREKGLAMAIAKKALGNKGSYYNVFKEHVVHPEFITYPREE